MLHQNLKFGRQRARTRTSQPTSPSTFDPGVALTSSSLDVGEPEQTCVSTNIAFRLHISHSANIVAPTPSSTARGSADLAVIDVFQQWRQCCLEDQTTDALTTITRAKQDQSPFMAQIGPTQMQASEQAASQPHLYASVVVVHLSGDSRYRAFFSISAVSPSLMEPMARFDREITSLLLQFLLRFSGDSRSRVFFSIFAASPPLMEPVVESDREITFLLFLLLLWLSDDSISCASA